MSGRINDIQDQLENLLQESLPGNEAHKLLEPETRRNFKVGKSIERARQSSVMIIIFPSGDFYSTYTILRPKYDGVHSNQIAFPGGQMEPQDRSLLDTAIRETREEINVTVKHDNVLGKLTDIYIPPSNFAVAPYIAWLDYEPVTQPQPSEVERIIEVNLRDILDVNAIVSRKLFLERYGNIEVPCFVVDDYIIWGATAMIMAEFREVLRKVEL